MPFQFGGICLIIFGVLVEVSVSATFGLKDFVCGPIKSFFFGFSSVANLATTSVPSDNSNNKKGIHTKLFTHHHHENKNPL
jgi:hypothetical protein